MAVLLANSGGPVRLINRVSGKEGGVFGMRKVVVVRGIKSINLAPFRLLSRRSKPSSFCCSSSASLWRRRVFKVPALLRIFPRPLVSGFRKQFALNPRHCQRRQIYSALSIQEEEPKRKKEKSEMTITPAIKISEKKLIVKGKTVLSGVPDNIIPYSVEGSGPVDGLFIGAEFAESNSRHVVPLGTLRNVRFMACFRFKLWWMAQRMGTSGGEVPTETQFLLVEMKDGSSSDTSTAMNLYVVFLPLIDGPFRASLQGSASDDNIELCLESGDPMITSSSSTHALFVSVGKDPFAAISSAIAAAKRQLKSFRVREEKKLPSIVDYFGWCTWDAFYQEVTASGVEAGLDSLSSGGTPPKFVIIDDGWQSVGTDDLPTASTGELFRLTGIKENNKFQRLKNSLVNGVIEQDDMEGIKHIVDIAKTKHGLKYVYVWHAITGYWGGVMPGVGGYDSAVQYPVPSPGVVKNEPGQVTDVITEKGLGLVPPKSVYRFYDELHSYLAAAGVDGVKVDVQCILENLGAGQGGRVELTKQYHRALDVSVSRNFPDNGIIACMSHNTDSLYCSMQTAVVRASDDFYPRDPVSHTIHIASVAYNSVFLGEFMQPDWDMFHSLHPAAHYHAAARAISGGPIYVSDKPGVHDFELLKKLVLPDGSVLRPRLPGRPTLDCLFADPARDGVSLLKIWNMNKFTGVVGVFNCQGAAWCKTEKKNVFHENEVKTLTGSLRGTDVHVISEAAIDSEWNGDCAVYSHNGDLVQLPNNASMPISLSVLEHETFTVTPIKVLGPGCGFAPLGLIDMINAGGAIQSYEVGNLAVSSMMSRVNLQDDQRPETIASIRMEVKGCGRFGAYSSLKPKRCLVDSKDIDFSYYSSSGLVTLLLEMAHSSPLQIVVVEI